MLACLLVKVRLTAWAVVCSLTLLVHSSVWAAGPVGSPSAEVVSLVEQAETARQTGDYRTAERHLRAAYTRQPLPVIMNNLGKLFEEEGRYLAAIEAYRTVTEDPAAPPELRALDRARLAALEPKARSAWVRAPAPAAWASLRVAGIAVPMEGNVEVGVPPGPVLVEVRPAAHLGTHRVWIQTVERGRRHIVAAPASADETAFLTLGGLSPPVDAMYLNGHRLSGDAGATQTLEMPAGAHAIRLESRVGKRLELRVSLAAGQSRALSDWAKGPWVAQHAPPPSAEDGMSPQVARLLRIMSVSLGAVLTGAGLYLNHDVEQTRAFIMDPERSPDMTMREAADQWELLNTRSMVGGTLTGLGSAMMMGGVVWWWLDDESATTGGRITVLGWPRWRPYGDDVLPHGEVRR